MLPKLARGAHTSSVQMRRSPRWHRQVPASQGDGRMLKKKKRHLHSMHLSRVHWKILEIRFFPRAWHSSVLPDCFSHAGMRGADFAGARRWHSRMHSSVPAFASPIKPRMSPRGCFYTSSLSQENFGVSSACCEREGC